MHSGKAELKYNCSSMPLDHIARRYADESFNGRMEKIIAEQQRKRIEIQAKHSGGMVQSGPFVSAVAMNEAETVRLLARARVETLLSAYEKAGTLFDVSALHEITNELSQFAQIKERHLTGFVAQFVNQTFGGNAPSNLISALSGQVETAVRSELANITRDLRIKQYEVELSGRVHKAYGAALGKKSDVFISYASADEDTFVKPLVAALGKDLSVWYAPLKLRVGDKLRKTIDDGIANSRFGIVVLSHHYFAKHWPQEELEGLFNKEIEGVKVILPVWHNINADEVRQYSPMLSGRVAAKTSDGLEVVVHQLREAMGLEDDVKASGDRSDSKSEDTEGTDGKPAANNNS